MEAGIGRAPFQVITIIAIPGTPDAGQFGAVDTYNEQMREAGQRAKKFGVRLCTCEVCGMSLKNNVVIRDADGKHFVAGLDCSEKSGDTEVIEKAKLIERRRQKALREAKREAARAAAQAKIEADQDSQRQRNGGLTDWEVQEKEIRDLRLAKRAKNRKANDDLISILLTQVRYDGDFTSSIIESILEGESITGRGRDIACEIFGKAFGRRNSKKFNAAYDRANELFERLAAS